MLNVSEARQRLLDALPTQSVENIALKAASGRVFAQDLRASEDSPRFDNSSMDGFAVRAADLLSASEQQPATLTVVGDIPAGTAVTKEVLAGQAMRIMTGAAMPPGADAVIPVEDTDAPVALPGAPLPAQVLVNRNLKSGDYVRPAGQDFHAGDVLLKAGSRLRPQDLALAAMLGQAELQVYKKPRVAILSSGDELVTVDQPLGPGKIHETNSYALAALVESAGGEPVLLGIAQDTLEDVQAILERAVGQGADLILSSAGVSVGAYDYLREAVLSQGELDFWKVNMRPGKPFAFGRYRGIPYIGLPGNPASAFVGFEVFVRAALHKMGGAFWQRRALRARVTEDVESDGRESYLRVQIKSHADGLDLLLTGHQGSGNLYSLVQAEGLMIVPAGVTHLTAGSFVDVWPL
jgi:molybdopterin molybdotransferase